MKRNLFKISFVLCLGSIALTSTGDVAEVQQPPSSFSFLNLQNGETLIVKRSYQGCWGGGPEASLTFTNQGVEIEDVGLIDLSVSELARLDNYYTLVTDPDNYGGCTTSKNYLFELIRPGRDNIIFKGSDSFCGSFLPVNIKTYMTDEGRQEYYKRISEKFFTFREIEARAKELYEDAE